MDEFSYLSDAFGTVSQVADHFWKRTLCSLHPPVLRADATIHELTL
jgi:hypothetical protein